ncbi:acetate--CoA ligase [Flavobacteriaceae bacterium]|nr:acetate--CoA ligase [Flavobacteriaceae bacterium]MDA9244789.1 acetate--CoA ligase [Flavobacteriaceae bacterium]MDA9886356.1 acetate--CoA ligase [Flavobacteriaceae bacterium]MDB4186944.1 acetate--CoA ligase [Flavobacteriaceae bacterium]MDB9821498.1 acetate--CoA ligase [Flavobacteriaceae bacterium]
MKKLYDFQLESPEAFQEAYRYSIDNPAKFWAEIASTFQWQQPWKEVLKHDWTIPSTEWFVNGKLNITENCLDRHVAVHPDKEALIWEPNDPDDAVKRYSYKNLLDAVCRFANGLKNQGIKKGDRVCIYMPMVPELTIAVLACARIGAVHSVVFAGFSSTALAARINDAGCTLLITADGAFRGDKKIPLKTIADEALRQCETVKKCIVFQRTFQTVDWDNRKDIWWHDFIDGLSEKCAPTLMDAEDPLFILYTSGSTGKPKGMVHSCGGYMVYTAYTFLNVFQYKPEDIYWCTADIGWITGHSYMVYGPLACGATSVHFEGVPSYPKWNRFWEICEKHKVTQFYTAPTAIRALAKHPTKLIDDYDLSSLKVLGSVGEPINDEAWNWYNTNIGKEKVPIVDTWWQTETGGILISSLAGVTAQKPTYATQPLPGIQVALVDDKGNPIMEQEAEGILTINYPWPGIARTIYGDHQRYKEVYFSAFNGRYFPGDGALRDRDGNYRITGRVDDVVIVSGHNLGTAPIENAINEHAAVVESAVVGYPHDVKGNALMAYVILYDTVSYTPSLFDEIRTEVAAQIGAIAKPDRILFVSGLPKTRSGKIMRRILRKLAAAETDQLGDISTLLNPEIVEEIIEKLAKE